jgi:hypothetical protein
MLLTSNAPPAHAGSPSQFDTCGLDELSGPWDGADLVSQRDALSLKWLNGKGLEIGALHKPVRVRGSVIVKYVDYKTLKENRRRYPELAGEKIVQTDIVDDGFVLDKVRNSSVDFIVANHALEHSPDPYGTLLTWKNKIAAGGTLLVAVPIADRCYDRGRPITTVEHLLEDHHRFQEGDVEEVLRGTREHLVEFLTISDKNIRVENNLPLQTHDCCVAVADKFLAGLEARVKEAIEWRAAEASRSSQARISRNFLSTCLDKIRRLTAAMKRKPSSATLTTLLISAHVQGLNRVYDIHYHTFSPASYCAFLSCFCDQEGMVLEEVRKSGGGECIAIVTKPPCGRAAGRTSDR